MSAPLRIMLPSVVAASLLSGCASTYLERAPPSPSEARIPEIPKEDTPVDVQPATSGTSAAAAPDEVMVPGRRYTLPGLVEIAASSNLEIRGSWQRARAAALAVGVVDATYWPTVGAVVLGGYQHSSIPTSSLVQGGAVAAQLFLPGITLPATTAGQTGNIGLDTYEVIPFLAIQWQLLDWGRGASKRIAEQTSVAANVVFVGEHQKLLFQIARAYFRLGAARAHVKEATDALERTRTMARSTEARYGRGITTSVELAEAGREVAQSEYDLTRARAAETVAYTALLNAMGIDPRTQLEIETLASGNLSEALPGSVDPYVEAALQARPDLKASMAHLSAARASVDQSEARYVPKIGILGTGGFQTLGAKLADSSFNTTTIPSFTALLTFNWVLFDGGARELGVEIARAGQIQAELEAARLRRSVVQEVLSAFQEANAALARYRSAQALDRTAAIADEARATAYTHGLSTLAEASSAQKVHSFALAAKEDAYAEARIAATALAFTAGQLTTVSAIPDPVGATAR